MRSQQLLPQPKISYISFILLIDFLYFTKYNKNLSSALSTARRIKTSDYGGMNLLTNYILLYNLLTKAYEQGKGYKMI